MTALHWAARAATPTLARPAPRGRRQRRGRDPPRRVHAAPSRAQAGSAPIVERPRRSGRRRRRRHAHRRDAAHVRRRLRRPAAVAGAARDAGANRTRATRPRAHAADVRGGRRPRRRRQAAARPRRRPASHVEGDRVVGLAAAARAARGDVAGGTRQPSRSHGRTGRRGVHRPGRLRRGRTVRRGGGDTGARRGRSWCGRASVGRRPSAAPGTRPWWCGARRWRWRQQRRRQPAGADRLPGGLTPLLFAARQGNMAAVRTLVECGVDVNQVSARRQDDAAAHRDDQRPLRPRDVSARPRREPEPGEHGGATPLYARDQRRVGAARLLSAAARQSRKSSLLS